MNSRSSLRDRLAERPRVEIPTHPDVARWRAAGPEDIEAIWRLQRAADEIDNPERLSPRSAINETFETSNVDPARDTLVAIGSNGEYLAHALCVVAGGHATRLQSYLLGTVHPLWRGRGIGRALLGWQVARSAEQLSEYELTLPGWTMLYVDATNEGLRALAGEYGLDPRRYYREMRHPLDAAIPPVPVPEGVRIVNCTEEYYDGTRIARNDAFRDHWGSQPNTKERWNRLVRGGHFRSDLSFVALARDGRKKERVVGFVLSTVTEPAEEALIELVGVVRAWRGRRLAPALLTSALAAGVSSGLPSIGLEVDSETPADANTLYAGLGFRPVGESSVYLREY
ncbi:GNAT family N-acetyltransferase [Mycetocola tolaasinivorans]|uniref:GNAT family N-acetyltransferase n=1 Tax=Mycetocola tolaasinivorans TaxID=76635 RepID=A0A3L7A9X6_9MICO|nr:GNAT family N-acetyltransferase [Mycetocola tolaasinivorans]RLP77236.1 GNAT family N-acetyltransferase [Mycetocola tolaasinivorans]